MSDVLSGAEFKKQLRAGTPKLGLFVNSLTQTGAYANDVEKIAKEKGRSWIRRDTALF